MKIKSKILLSLLSATAIVIIAVSGYVGFSSRKLLDEFSTDLADTYAGQYANLAKADLNEYMQITRQLKHTFENYENIPEENRREFFSKLLYQILEQNTGLLSTWSILRPTSIDNQDTLYINKPGSTILGNFRYIYYRDGNNIKLSDYIEQNPAEVLSGTIFNFVKNRGKETIVDPYYYSYTASLHDEIMQTNMVAPVLKDGEFLGVVGVDVSLASLQEIVDGYQPLHESFAFLFTQSGSIVTFPDRLNIGKDVFSVGLINENKGLFKEAVEDGMPFSFNTQFKGESFYVSVAVVNIGETESPWFLGVAFPRKSIMASASKTMNIAIIAGLVGLLLIAFIIWVIAGNISNPIKLITSAIKRISEGKVDKSIKLQVNTGDELEDMANALNKYIDGYISKAEFAEKIGQGNLDAQLDSIVEEDHLAKSLVKMRENLKTAKQEEMEKQMEGVRKTNWVNEGLNTFAEILRQNNNDIEILSYEIIQHLVKYLDANQGGIFIINDDNEEVVFELKAAFAYDRRKFMEKSFARGVGLVGSCAVEKKTIYLTDIPQSYIKIESGLGSANPDAILIVPLLKDDKVFGVIEIASFNKLEKYQIQFVEKVSENIASTLQYVKNNLKTSILLKQSQEQAEAMKAQEDEMMKNMEELIDMQEQMEEKERLNNDRIDELSNLLKEKEQEIDQLKENLENKKKE
jgi:methyl-accepting chemotaxis protein